MYLTGRLAAIELSPATSNLWGARVAALRITRALTGLTFAMMLSKNPFRIRLGQKADTSDSLGSLCYGRSIDCFGVQPTGSCLKLTEQSRLRSCPRG